MAYTYKEKTFAPVAFTVPNELTNPPKIPYFALKTLARANLGKLRAGMGGNTRDIARRPILRTQVEIPGYQGLSLPLFVYRPEAEAAAPRPLFVFFHGGGWFGGSCRVVDAFCRAVTDQADCVVVSVDYHLCPEYPFPHGLEDAYAAARWAAGEPTLGIDPARVAVGGDSAGGNLAAAVALLARERGEPTIHRQVLLYPAVTLRDFVSPLGGDGVLFGRLLADWYCGGPEKAGDPLISPLHAASHAGLPATLMAVGSLDGLLPQCKRYAQVLDSAGVAVTFLCYENTQHSFIDNTGTQPAADDLVAEVAAFLGQQ